MEDSVKQVTTAAASAASATVGGECEGGGVGCLLSGIACCCAAAVFYLAGRRSQRGASELRMARRFTRISDLSAALDSEGVLALVTLRGQVGSETPIVASQSGCQAVIAEQQVQQHYKTKHITKTIMIEINKKDGDEYLVLKRTKATNEEEYLVVKRTRVKVDTEHRPTKRVRDIDVGQWVHGTNLVSSTKNEVPWYMEDATGRFHVVEAHKATGFTLNRESSVFEENKQLCSRCQVCGQEGSVKVVELERTERVLPTGTTFTVVGEAYKDHGTVLIKRPRELGRFYVSRRGIDQIISDLKEASTGEDTAAAIFAFSGCVLLACHALL